LPEMNRPLHLPGRIDGARCGSSLWNPYAPAPHSGSTLYGLRAQNTVTSTPKGVTMSDIIFLALGAGAFALFAAYARLIAQI